MLQTLLLLIPIPLITAVVQLFKEVGMPSKYAKLAAFVLAMMFATLATVNNGFTQILVAILQYALGAIGLWELAGPAYKNIGNPQQPAVDSQKVDDSTTNQS